MAPERRQDSIQEPTKNELDLIEKEYFPNYEFDYSIIDQLDSSESEVTFYLATLPKVKFNTREEDERLVSRIKNGDNPEEARDALFYSCARMVVAEAVKRASNKVSVMDLVGIGNLALIDRAIKNYDPKKGKFSTYAMWWIRSAQGRAVKEASRPYKSVEHDVTTARRLNKIIYSHMASHEGKKPTIDELSVLTGLKPKRIRYVLTYSEEKIISIQDQNEEENSEIGDLIPDPSALRRETLEDRIDFNTAKNMVETALNQIPKREARVLKLRLGIDNDGNWTDYKESLDEIGTKLGITRERARQLQTQAVGQIEDKVVRKAIIELLHMFRN